MDLPAIQYTIHAADVDGHRYHVTLRIANPDPAGQILRMPAWIPGSYLIRDFSKHIESITAFAVSKAGQTALTLDQIDNDTWKLPAIESNGAAIEVHTIVYAFDTSVRTAYLDHERGFFNPSSLCLAVENQTHLPTALALAPLGNWSVQTTLRPVKTDAAGFGFYLAPNYDALLDHPVALGHFQMVEWRSRGVAHSMAIQGCLHPIDRKRLITDLRAICDSTIDLFEPKTQEAPFDRYLFLVNAVLSGYGGLEHRDSTALLCNRDQLPQLNVPLNEEAYREFLGLCSHEYIHAWLVKRIQPSAFQPYDLQRRNYTRLLWLFEGFTSYYDDLQLLRSGRIELQTYLNLVAKNWNMVLRGPGRHKQSVANSSFDAWTKYYQADENTPNAVVSYYAKGALVALGLDLLIRTETRQRKSLDTVMQLLWASHGKTQLGLAEDGFDRIVLGAIGPDFKASWLRFKARFINGTDDLPLESWLKSKQIQVTRKTQSPLEDMKLQWGMRYKDSNGWIAITHVLDGGIAQLAGLAPGDILASINGQRLTSSRLDTVFGSLQLGTNATLRFYRQDREHESQLVLQPSRPVVQYQLTAL
ncbi:MAG: PDZ domain-containing protein [Polynucleobacter sp.]|nr:PDZ domain-containing protein [Polynucleobacter sp.]